MEPKIGPGAFQWNLGGWFGAQIGATLWLVLMGGLVAARHSVPSGLAVLGLGLAPNVIGWWLWHRRETLAPYPAIQMLVAVCGVAAAAAVLVLGRVGVAKLSVDVPGAWVLLIYPGLMLWFHLQEQSAKKHTA